MRIGLVLHFRPCLDTKGVGYFGKTFDLYHPCSFLVYVAKIHLQSAMCVCACNCHIVRMLIIFLFLYKWTLCLIIYAPSLLFQGRFVGWYCCINLYFCVCAFCTRISVHTWCCEPVVVWVKVFIHHMHISVQYVYLSTLILDLRKVVLHCWHQRSHICSFEGGWVGVFAWSCMNA